MEMDSTFLSTPDIILDHLYIALNCIVSLNPIVDGNACDNIIGLCSLPAAAEITAEAVEPFLHATVQVFGTRGCSTIDHREIRSVEALCRLDATNGLSQAALCGLLKAAAETLPSDEIISLFYLLAVRQLDPAQKVEVVLILARAFLAARKEPGDLSMNFPRCVLNIDKVLPGTPKALRASLFKALFVLSTRDTGGCHHHAALVVFGVMSAPGMDDFSTAVLVELLRYVLEKGAKDPRLPDTVVAFFLESLCKCPAATELGIKGATQLLHLARTLLYSRDIVNKLQQLQAAQQLKAAPRRRRR